MKRLITICIITFDIFVLIQLLFRTPEAASFDDAQRLELMRNTVKPSSYVTELERVLRYSNGVAANLLFMSMLALLASVICIVILTFQRRAKHRHNPHPQSLVDDNY